MPSQSAPPSITYVHGRGIISQSLADGAGGSDTSYYLAGHQGTVRQLSDPVAQITDAYFNDAFGVELTATGDTPNAFRFAGEQLDAALDEYYLRDRYYASAAGRFRSTDRFDGVQSEPLTLHDYLYGHANPVFFTDPRGLFSLGELGAAEAIRTTISQSIATVGNFALESIDQKSFAWQSIGLDAVFALLPVAGEAFETALESLTDLIGPLLSRVFEQGGVAAVSGVVGVVASGVNKLRPGKVVDVIDYMLDISAKYQKQVTGLGRGKAYLVNGVKFDGILDGVLIETKGPGYLKLLDRAETLFGLGNKLIAQAKRQIDVANGVPIRWVVAEEGFADKLKYAFKLKEFPIEVAL